MLEPPFLSLFAFIFQLMKLNLDLPLKLFKDLLQIWKLQIVCLVILTFFRLNS